MAGTLPIVTTSERRAFKRCPQRWWWSFRQGLAPVQMSEKLWFGIGIHEVLAYLLQPGTKRPKDFLDKWYAFTDEDQASVVIRERLDDGQSRWADARELGAAMLKGYVEFYDWDKKWYVLYTEEPFAIEIPDPTNPKRSICIFNSTFDGVYRDEQGRCWLMEHKTAASIGNLAYLEMDDQAGAYWAIATQVLREKGILGPRERIVGIMYNFLLKRMPDDDRPQDEKGYYHNKPNKQHFIEALPDVNTAKMTLERMADLAEQRGIVVLGEISKNQPPPLFERKPIRRTANERAKQILNIGNETHAMNWHRQTDGAYLYKNQTRDCGWDCQFYEMCTLHEANADWDEFRDARFVVRDPYDRYRLRKSAADVI